MVELRRPIMLIGNKEMTLTMRGDRVAELVAELEVELVANQAAQVVLLGLLALMAQELVG